MARLPKPFLTALCYFLATGLYEIALADDMSGQNAISMNAMAKLFDGHVKLDNKIIITSVEVGTCKTVFTTSDGSTVVDWSQIENPSGHVVDGKDILPLVSPAGEHDLSSPVERGDDPIDRDMESVVGFLSANCEGYKGN